MVILLLIKNMHHYYSLLFGQWLICSAAVGIWVTGIEIACVSSRQNFYQFLFQEPVEIWVICESNVW